MSYKGGGTLKVGEGWRLGKNTASVGKGRVSPIPPAHKKNTQKKIKNRLGKIFFGKWNGEGDGGKESPPSDFANEISTPQAHKAIFFSQKKGNPCIVTIPPPPSDTWSVIGFGW